MPKFTKDDIMNKLKEHFKDDNSDEAIALISDISDYIDEVETETSENWKEKYEQNDAEWRQKYKDRFFSGSDKDDPANDPEVLKGDDKSAEALTFDKLFKEEGK